uniref:Uncharacterized protein n=1 Tax=Rhizobium leguminosarum TaxID=384 RepID=A0A154IBL4_RHILE|nr:hypothetical protein A4A59_04870 [Rhizobium leguminosarum]
MRTVLYSYRGQRWLIAELADISGVPAPTLHKRLVAGWTLEQAIATPTPKQRRRGVVSNLGAFEGTGGGSTSQDSANITF